MKRVIISSDACPGLKDHLMETDHEIMEFQGIDTVADPVKKHPDLVFCSIKNGMVFEGDPLKLSEKYPGDVIYNGCSTGKYFIHNLKITAPELMGIVEKAGLIPVNIRQGYSRCSILPVDEDSVITYDSGSAKAMRAAGLNVLVIRPGHVLLPGYNEGFIGGTAGKVGCEILFNGDLSLHPDFDKICDFIQERGLRVKYFSGWPLTDIGSIIEAESIFKAE